VHRCPCSALKIIEKTHVGDKGKPGFRWLGPEGLQTLRAPSVAAHHHLQAAAAPAFHLQPGSFQAALTGELPALSMAASAAAGTMPDGSAAGVADASGVQVSLPAPASLYVGADGGAGAGMQLHTSASTGVSGGSAGGGGGIKRPRRKSLRAREAEADTDEEYVAEEEEEYDEEGSKRRGSEDASNKRVKGECC